jgi:hypothetical protein
MEEARVSVEQGSGIFLNNITSYYNMKIRGQVQYFQLKRKLLFKKFFVWRRTVRYREKTFRWYFFVWHRTVRYREKTFR